ncbi:hypothetical protein EDD37DRAFT_674193 [Exophiala viscosa]|uniref:Uncharacterized protein n=1 Tax=Exophiala viscosa TaxID=2486360 RepID=A0AAN6DNY9_9EURO|nr:hypothetical protein EDD36DRAFT_481910 [Exophiala viscosa]KAI1620592.1 hypothetical protein EDD37DRAFT_674193 [Exophiala viscosa]
MTDHKVRKRQERTYLCTALDKAADQFTGNNFKSIPHAIKAILEFYSKDVDIGKQSREENLTQKILYAAKRENVKSTAFLKDWSSLKSRFDLYRQFVQEQALQSDGNTQPIPATGTKLKFVLGQTSTKKSAPTGAQGDDEDDGESIASTTRDESDPEDGTYTEPEVDRPRTTVSEKKDTATKPGKTASADLKARLIASTLQPSSPHRAPAASKAKSTASTLHPSSPNSAPSDPKVRSTAGTLQPSSPHSAPPSTKFRLGYGDPPNHKDIAMELDCVLQSLDQGIRHFHEVHALVKLTPTRLTNDSVALSRELLRPSKDQIHRVEQNLAALFANEAITMDLVFRSYAAAAVNKWVFNDFNDFIDIPDSQILSSVRELDRGIYDQLKVMERTRFLDNLKATIPQQAIDAERKLLDILESLGISAASVAIGMVEPTAANRPQGTVEHRAEQHGFWQDRVRSAFSQALNLRLKLARSPMGYVYRWPCVGWGFDKKWMRSVHDERTPEVEASAPVLLCLRPAIWSSYNNDLLLIVPALVMFQGFGAPAAGKIPFLNRAL